MIGESEILVHVHLTEFSFGRSMSGEFDIRTIGQ